MSFACTEECRDEHCVHPIACEVRGQCPPQNPDLQSGDGLDVTEFVVKQPRG
jgi:hypothetical protein